MLNRIVLAALAVLAMAGCDPRSQITEGVVIEKEYDPPKTCRKQSPWHKANPLPCREERQEWEITIRGVNGYGKVIEREFEYAVKPVIFDRVRIGDRVRVSDLR